MPTTRMEAFSDAVIAIVITIMVLELKVPEGSDTHALREVLPHFLVYALSFVFLGIYWNNHHHLLQACSRISGGILWANLHLLFWLSLVPATTAWVGEHTSAAVPTAVYGIVLLLAGVAYYVLQQTIISHEGPGSKLASLGRDSKGLISVLLYALAVGLAFVNPILSDVIYIVVALIWLVPDRRIEKQFQPAP